MKLCPEGIAYTDRKDAVRAAQYTTGRDFASKIFLCTKCGSWHAVMSPDRRVRVYRRERNTSGKE